MAGSAVGSSTQKRRTISCLKKCCLVSELRVRFSSAMLGATEASSDRFAFRWHKEWPSTILSGIPQYLRPDCLMLQQTSNAGLGFAAVIFALCAAANAVAQPGWIEQLQHQATGALYSAHDGANTSLLIQGYYVDPFLQDEALAVPAAVLVAQSETTPPWPSLHFNDFQLQHFLAIESDQLVHSGQLSHHLPICRQPGHCCCCEHC